MRFSRPTRLVLVHVLFTAAVCALFADTAAARPRRNRPTVRSFSFVDAATGKPIPGYSRMRRRAVVSLRTMRNRAVDISVNTKPSRVGSVVFTFDNNSRVRNRYPYRLAGKRAWRTEAGVHTIVVVPHSRRNARGRRGTGGRLKLTVLDDSSKPAEPTPTPTLTPFPLPDDGMPLKVWANEGGDKVVQEDLRYSTGGPSSVLNSAWDGTAVKLFGARNEVVSFNLIIEAPQRALKSVTVRFDRLNGPGGNSITSHGTELFDYRGRSIELFYTRYLKIKGLSRLGYETYDERHIPARFRRPHEGPSGRGSWSDRPDHDRSYPDIAVPLELVRSFDVPMGTSQSIWVDIYIPKGVPAGWYNGVVTIAEGSSEAAVKEVPVALQVRDFTLPDAPAARTMLYLGYSDINKRYLGERYPSDPASAGLISRIRDRHFQMAHRHKISLIDDNDDSGASADRPSADWIPRLNGALFTEARGYSGPGAGVGNGVFSIGTYGSWGWRDDASIRRHSDAWVQWFNLNSPQTEYFLYLIDEVYDYPKIGHWAEVLNSNPGPGRSLMSFATISAAAAAAHVPGLDIACSTGGIGQAAEWDSAANYYRSQPGKRFCFYNGRRPQSGSFMIEDDGVALRELAWAQFKLGIQRWFYWESAYYNNFQAGAGETNVFRQAHTFGAHSYSDPLLGETGWNYSNGDGVLFYPGTDRVFPAESYEIEGPIASLRLKHWRRGIQDADYLSLAAQVDPAAVSRIVNRLVPKALWEYGVSDPNDPTWVLTDISWPTDPDVWEAARGELSQIIETSGRFR